MSVHTWLLFAMTTCMVSAIPGPNMIFIMSVGARYGLRSASWAMPGCLTALLIMLVVSAAGLATLMEAWPPVFFALRIAGAAYLVYLGVKSWCSKSVAIESTSVEAQTEVSGRALCYKGFLVGASNPKAMLFAAALLPQFISSSSPILPQMAALVATFALFEVIWYLVYATAGVKIREHLRNRKTLIAFNRATGGVFVAFGAVIAAAHR